MSNLLKKPTNSLSLNNPAKFERFFLSENPFPAQPFLNKDSTDKRINGAIYEPEIRSIEFEKIKTQFLAQPQTMPNHLRLGYIIDKSYVGRGNGKSAFLINLQQKINANYCLDISDGKNKCFAVYVTPELGGRTKTFSSFVDSIFISIIESNMINTSLAMLRLESISKLYPNAMSSLEELPEDELIRNLNTEDWFKDSGLDAIDIESDILQSEYLQSLPTQFPLSQSRNRFLFSLVTQKNFEEHYREINKKPSEKFNFVFSDLVSLFLSAGFNGAYILVDNFEQVVQFQSAKQKIDFAFELRSYLFDGTYLSARLGFYNSLLVFHAGVPRLIGEAWNLSGMESRSPIASQTVTNHIIPFEKLRGDHVALLLKKYLAEYRIASDRAIDDLYPFSKESVEEIGRINEFTASRILGMACFLLDKLAESPDKEVIDVEFINSVKESYADDSNKPISTVETAETVDLLEKANK